ncbi:MAG: hypothetical protein M1436_05565, partial [Acidobacteria bacterium]|nr:hypothetical protein [Acidobacteriota bacterium]
MSDWLFPLDTPAMAWAEFAAGAFAAPVAGMVYRPGQSSCGLPLAGIGTGCIDLDTDGTFGRCTVFNSYV